MVVGILLTSPGCSCIRTFAELSTWSHYDLAGCTDNAETGNLWSIIYCVSTKVLMALCIIFMVFYNVTLHSLVNRLAHFGATWLYHIHSVLVRLSKKNEIFMKGKDVFFQSYTATLQTTIISKPNCHENLKSHFKKLVMSIRSTSQCDGIINYTIGNIFTHNRFHFIQYVWLELNIKTVLLEIVQFHIIQ